MGKKGKVSIESHQEKQKDTFFFFFPRHLPSVLLQKMPGSFLRLRVREALLTNPGRHPIRFQYSGDKRQQMGSYNCHKVTWKCKAMSLVVFAVTQLTFSFFHFSFNQFFNFTCWIPYNTRYNQIFKIYLVENFSFFVIYFSNLINLQKVFLQFATKRQ